MANRSGTGRGPVLLAGALLVIAAAVFGVAFYFYDGMSVAQEIIATLSGSTTLGTQPEPASAAEVLELPKGMPQEFALRVWQEQADSQRAIAPLVGDKVDSLKIDKVTVTGDVAKVDATLAFKDGTKAPGVIGLHRYADTWYVTYVSANASTDEGQQAESKLPDVSGVDVTLLNAVMAEQAKGRPVTQDIIDGRIDLLKTGTVRSGPNTVTIPLVMKGEGSDRTADLIAIRSESNGKEFWFLARFNETGSTVK